MKRVRVGLIGYGSWGKRHHASLLKSPRFELIGIYDPKYRGRGFYRSLKSLLKEVDAADIVTPPRYLSKIALQALEAGRHVLVEKPMAVNLKEASELLRAWRRSGRIGLVGFVERFNPVFKKIKAMKGMRPSFVFCQRSGTPTLVTKETGVMKDLAIHDIDLLRWIYGEPKAIRGAEYDRGLMAHLHLKYEGFEASILSDCLGPQKIRRWVVQARSGRNLTASFAGDRWSLFEGMREVKLRWTPPLDIELDYFARCIIEDVPGEPSIEDGHGALWLIEKALKPL